MTDVSWESLVLPAAGTPAEKSVTAAATPPTSTAKLSDVFQTLGYDLNAVREHGMVPRVFLAALPRDLPAIPDSDARKLVFIKMMLPLVLHVNEMVAHDRDRILSLRKTFARTKTLPAADGEWLRGMAASYGLDGDADFDELLRRVDIVPTSLAVAQAAIESGWGTSRFAHEGNALFGQYTFKDASTGLVPQDREDGKTHKVKSFDTLVDAVKAYATNLNTNAAYEEFRKARAADARQGARPGRLRSRRDAFQLLRAAQGLCEIAAAPHRHERAVEFRRRAAVLATGFIAVIPASEARAGIRLVRYLAPGSAAQRCCALPGMTVQLRVT